MATRTRKRIHHHKNHHKVHFTKLHVLSFGYGILGGVVTHGSAAGIHTVIHWVGEVLYTVFTK
jgi:hypothetical protein